MRGYAAYRYFCLYLHKRMRTKINYKGSVTQDMESVNEKKLYIVCAKIKKFSNPAELSDFPPVLLLYRSFEKGCHRTYIDNFTAWYWELYRCMGQVCHKKPAPAWSLHSTAWKYAAGTPAQEVAQGVMRKQKLIFFRIRTCCFYFLLQWLAENRKLYMCKKL